MRRSSSTDLATLVAVLSLSSCSPGASSSSHSSPDSSSSVAGERPPATPCAPDPPASPNGDSTGAVALPLAWPYRHFDVNHVLSTGESNAVANDATPPISAAQPYTNLELDTGILPARECDERGCRAYAKPTAFMPLVEGDAFFGYGVETMSSGLANEAAKLARDDHAAGITTTPAHDVLVSLHGRSGSTYLCLRKGGCPAKGAEAGYVPSFEDAMMAVSDAMAIAKVARKSYVVRAVTALAGESDHHAYATRQQDFPMPGTSGQRVIADYRDAMVEWQEDYETSVRAITGQTLPVPLFLLQMSNWNDVRRSRIPTWQLEAHVTARGRVIVVGPGYPIGYAADCRHFTNHGQRRIGEYFGKAYARVVLEGRRWEPLRPIAVEVQRNIVIARFAVPKPPLVLDATHVTDPGSYGFEFTDDSAAPPAITKVELSGPDTVKITLASAPTGNDKRLRYAFTATPAACPGPVNGPRGNLRDSDDTPSHHGYDLWNWSVHFDEPAR